MADALMKRRWRRLNRHLAGFCGGEARRLGRGLDLLEIGCAQAEFEAWVRPHLARYTGIEPSQALLPKGRAEGKAFRLLRGQAEKLPLKPGAVDLVLIREALDRSRRPDKVLAESLRVLRSGGLLLLALPNGQAWHRPARHPGLAGSGSFGPDRAARLLRGAGFMALGAADSQYLFLSESLEGPLGRLPEGVTDLLFNASDAVGALLAPGMGGSFWAWGRKP